MVGGKKGNRTEPNRTTGLYRTEPTEISDSCGTGFYRRHRTEPANAKCLVPIQHNFLLIFFKSLDSTYLTVVSRFYLFQYNLLYLGS